MAGRLLAAALLVAAATPALAAAVTVEVRDNSFSPSIVSIAPGDTVTWDWVGSFPHSVVETSSGTVWCSTRSGAGAADCSRTFPTGGEFGYHCSVHGLGMRGTVRVVDPDAPNLDITAMSITGSGTRTISVTVANTGVDPAGASSLRLSYSAIARPVTFPLLSVPALDGGASTTVTQSWNANGKVGTFTVTALADAAKAVAELNEDDNGASATTTFVASGPPIVVLTP